MLWCNLFQRVSSFARYKNFFFFYKSFPRKIIEFCDKNSEFCDKNNHWHCQQETFFWRCLWRRNEQFGRLSHLSCLDFQLQVFTQAAICFMKLIQARRVFLGAPLLPSDWSVRTCVGMSVVVLRLGVVLQCDCRLLSKSLLTYTPRSKWFWHLTARIQQLCSTACRVVWNPKFGEKEGPEPIKSFDCIRHEPASTLERCRLSLDRILRCLTGAIVKWKFKISPLVG